MESRSHRSQWQTKTRVSDEVLQRSSSSAIVFETELRRLTSEMRYELYLRAISQYEYARVDELETRLEIEYGRHCTSYPKNLSSHVWKKLSSWLTSVGWIGLASRCASRIELEHLTYYLPEEKTIAVRDLLDGILLQIHYLKKHDIEPQAIIAHPEVVYRFKAENLKEDIRDPGPQVFGLRVIEDPKMKTKSAYVV